MKEKSCAIIGSPILSFPWGYDEDDEVCCALKLLAINTIFQLHKQGISRFIVPLDSGIGLYAAEAVNVFRESHTDMKLICYVPYEEQAVKWSPQLWDRYFAVVEKCTEEEFISTEKTPTCELDAMLEAIDQAGIVIAVCSSEDFQDKAFATAVRYAKRMGLEVTLLTPPKIY